MSAPIFVRKLGPQSCFKTDACPDVLELADGDFAVIGADITTISTGLLPAGVGCGPDERIVRIPRRILIAARADIPSA